MKFKQLFGSLSAILITGLCPVCADQDPAELTKAKKWNLVSWTSDIDIPEAERSLPYISFKDGNYSGRGGVNQYGGKYTAKTDGTVKLMGMAITEMAALDPAIMKLESTYIGLLEKATHWSIDEETLILSDGTKDNQLRFSPRVEGEANTTPLKGTNWRLIGIEKHHGDEVAFTEIPDSKITLSINDDNRAGGFGGVNRYSGTAKLAGKDGISFGPMMMTRKGAIGPAMQQEADYMKQLGQVAGWSIKGNQLKLSDEEYSFVLVFESN